MNNNNNNNNYYFDNNKDDNNGNKNNDRKEKYEGFYLWQSYSIFTLKIFSTDVNKFFLNSI